MLRMTLKVVCTLHCFVKCYATVQNCIKNGSKPSFQSTLWSPHTSDDNCTTCILRQKRAKVGRPKSRRSKAGGKRKKNEPTSTTVPPKVFNVADMMALDATSIIPQDIERTISHILDIKVKQSKRNTLQIKSGGPITVARKQSHDVCNKTLRKRSNQTASYCGYIWYKFSSNFHPNISFCK